MKQTNAPRKWVGSAYRRQLGKWAISLMLFLFTLRILC